MRLPFVRTLGLLMLAAAGIASRSVAGTITIPIGLAPGSQYRLAFVTSQQTYTAISSNIADYDNEVNAEANSVPALAALGTTWLDIGSTASVNAITHIPQDPGIPIYGLDGILVATDATTSSANGLWSNFLNNDIDHNEFGTFEAASVWTGTEANGTVAFALGSSFVVTTGLSVGEFGNWAANGGSAPSNTAALYAISGVLTVPSGTSGPPGAAPEPSTIVVVTSGLGLLLFAKRRGHGSRPGIGSLVSPASRSCAPGR